MGYIGVEQALRAINGETVVTRIDSGVDIITTDNAKEKLDFSKKNNIEAKIWIITDYTMSCVKKNKYKQCFFCKRLRFFSQVLWDIKYFN
ncbi:hypothetical protein GCM10020331_021420 [Ectobacillus funiculus]